MLVSWQALHAEIENCNKCPLCSGRQSIVIGDGKLDADVMFIGEGPGAQEDISGKPFVGNAGQLLTQMISAIEVNRQECYITNVVKCRPPNNRTPIISETDACIGYLRVQFALVRPKIIVLLGATAARSIIDPSVRITRDRGIWHERKGVHMIATYHPSALLRDESLKRTAWQDMKSIRDKMKQLGCHPLKKEQIDARKI